MLAAMPPTPTPTPDPGEPRIRDRGDACPGALRLHSADDGRLARLRLPAGRLTARQVEVLAVAAETLGDGRISITSRGNAELRGLADDCGARLAELLAGAGLLPSPTHERVRNIVASPAAGLDGLGAADVQLWARELDALLCATPWAAALSGRFLFVLDDGRGDVAGLGGDVTLVAVRGGAALLYVGGRALRVAAADAARAALAAAGAFLTAAREAGTGAWRVRELPEDHEPDVPTALTEACVPAEPADPTEPAEPTDPAEPAEPAEPADPADPATVRSHARTLDPTPARKPEPPQAPVPPLPQGSPPPPGPLGSAAVCLLAPLGRLTAAQLRALLPADEVRFTPWRGVVVAGAGPERLPALDAAGLVTRPDSPWVGISACTGRPGCAKALADVRADAAPGPVGAAHGLPVHFSGCERRCGHPHGRWTDVLATPGGDYLVDGVPAPRTALPEAVTTARTTTR
ncbi:MULTISPECIES: cobalamin biosynthesis protein CobG [Streptomyces]|nr:cobalamin biosynthesis protein CobG [Streptomyces venezuelae]APE26331.1 cobalamin biosynthesis protein CobG [Streptomyces venezuelae]QES03708.1 cobalamin biosynthesis protein CobG [Streptomyces venezuelae ATCC 10712]